MARTPLFAALQKVARQFRIARRLGISLASLHELQANTRSQTRTTPTRRSLLIGASSAAAALALSSLGRARARSGSPAPKIVIVGGGLSGLCAALALRNRGLDFTLYEASKRLGGRVYSNAGTWLGGQISEWGGELIDTGHTTVRELASSFGLELDDLHAAEPEASEETNYFLGSYYSRAELEADFAPVFEVLQQEIEGAGYPTTYASSTAIGRALDSISVFDWIETRVPGGHSSRFGQFLEQAYGPEYGADTSDQSALNLIYLLGFQPEEGGFSTFGESDERSHIRGGNQRLPLAIAQWLGGKSIKLGRRCESLRMKSNGSYEITFQHGSAMKKVAADFVILALPFAVLRDLDFAQAGFDALKSFAITELGRGHNGKLQMQFQSRPWTQPGPWGISNGSSQSDTGYQQTWEVTRAQPGVRGILNVYTGGSISDALVTTKPFATHSDAKVQQDVAKALAQLAPVFPGLSAQWNGRATSSLWHKSELQRCSYSYWRVGQYTSFAGYEKVPQARVFFCGEHTSTDFQGFMEGAAAEGLRAGHEVADAIGDG